MYKCYIAELLSDEIFLTQKFKTQIIFTVKISRSMEKVQLIKLMTANIMVNKHTEPYVSEKTMRVSRMLMLGSKESTWVSRLAFPCVLLSYIRLYYTAVRSPQ